MLPGLSEERFNEDFRVHKSESRTVRCAMCIRSTIAYEDGRVKIICKHKLRAEPVEVSGGHRCDDYSGPGTVWYEEERKPVEGWPVAPDASGPEAECGKRVATEHG